MTDPDADRSTVVLHKSGIDKDTFVELSIADTHVLLDRLTTCIAAAENYNTPCHFEMSVLNLNEPTASRLVFVINRRV